MYKQLKKIYHFIIFKCLFPICYYIGSRKKTIKNKTVFMEAYHPKLTNSLSYMYSFLERTGEYPLAVHCLGELYFSKLTYIRNAVKCLLDLGTAEYVFACEGSPVIGCLHPRPETKFIQLWHGCGAFKRFGFSTADSQVGYAKSDHLKYPLYKNFDLVTVSSPEVIWAYNEAMNYTPESNIVQALGISRTDIFFDSDFKKKAYENLKKTIPQISNKKVILYAPTFRGNVGNASAPDQLDIPLLQKTLGKDYILLIKQHPLVKKYASIPESASGFAFDVTHDSSIDELLCVCDICISDYSSLIFEYSLFEKPMIFFAYDLDNYLDWRGFYYNYDELTPGPVLKTTEEIIAYISAIDTQFDPQTVRDFRIKFMSACDGHATERIVKAVMKES